MIRTVSKKGKEVTIYIGKELFERLGQNRSKVGIYVQGDNIHIAIELPYDLYDVQRVVRDRVTLDEDVLKEVGIHPGDKVSVTFNSFVVPRIIIKKFSHSDMNMTMNTDII